MEYLPGLKKGFTITIIICLIVFSFFLLVYNNSFFKNKFTISINGVDINPRYESEFREILLIKNESEGRLYSYSKASSLLNEIQSSDKYILDFHEYEAYDKFNHRESFDIIYTPKSLKEVTNSQNRLKIERLGKVLYDGDFKEDISDILNEEGRYYFHIYNKSKRKSTPFARVNTTLTFNVLVVNHED